MTRGHLYIVARERGAGLDDTYADLVGDSTPLECLEYLAGNVALWEPGTELEWWTVRAADAAQARIMGVRRRSRHTVGDASTPEASS